MNDVTAFHPVMTLPDECPIFDFSKAEPSPNPDDFEFGIGKYLENRPYLYKESQYDHRVIHMGVDIQAPVGAEIFSPCDGRVWGVKYNSLPQDYGYTLITEHTLNHKSVWFLYGHLSKKSIEGKQNNQSLNTGEVIAWVGDRDENGGWKPHLHFQLSTVEPKEVDMPGVVSVANLEEAKIKYPDPRTILGPIY